MYGHVFRIVLVSGVMLTLVACAQRQAPAPVTRVYQGPSIHDFEPNSLAGETYHVARGDTLYSIAFRANLDVRTLARYNGLAEPYTIFPGQELRLAAKTTPLNATREVTRRSQVVDSAKKKEYVEDKSKEKVTSSSPKPAVKPTPDRQPSMVKPGTERFPASNALGWQWPTRHQVIRDFSTAASGNKGIDFAGTKGDPVFAAAAGKVVYAGNALKGYGNLIILKHNDDYITAYAHNDKLLIKEQQWVSAGDEIAEMGNTEADRVKLHFEIRFRGKSVNPRHYLPRGSQ
ncbi:peptidoglycan DD-metalloendopeptidase family protein [Pseudidiomarina sp. E22-M8]|uniref:peptidoglycan DD-metalloendopeptidase family protein n=1 Tax=Pseudidiomarina sp. E22-M8 TaxID=3424768 RepID=UPI00403C5BFF